MLDDIVNGCSHCLWVCSQLALVGVACVLEKLALVLSMGGGDRGQLFIPNFMPVITQAR